MACSSVTGIGFEAEQIAVTGANSSDNVIDSLIRPYKVKMDAKMDSTIAIADQDFTKGRPGGALNNWAADAIYNQVEQSIKDQLPKLCLLNVGGLRNPINKGNVSLGDIFKLMPFDNELVVLELNKEDYLGLLDYICKRGGEPFSGINITMDKEGNVINNSWPVNFENNEKVKVITSDYLANGGDKMSFFQNKEQYKVGLKLRDAIIDHCTKTDTITATLDGRIKIIDNE